MTLIRSAWCLKDGNICGIDLQSKWITFCYQTSKERAVLNYRYLCMRLTHESGLVLPRQYNNPCADADDAPLNCVLFAPSRCFKSLPFSLLQPSCVVFSPSRSLLILDNGPCLRVSAKSSAARIGMRAREKNRGFASPSILSSSGEKKGLRIFQRHWCNCLRDIQKIFLFWSEEFPSE